LLKNCKTANLSQKTDKNWSILPFINIDPRRIFDKMKEVYLEHLLAADQTINYWQNHRAKGVFSVSVNPQYMPSFLEEFRSMKLEMMIRDLHKLTHEELMRIQKEIDQLLHSDKE
jgi:hypothetical protein